MLVAFLTAGSEAQVMAAVPRYTYVPQKATWPVARAYCASHGGILAKVSSQADQAALVAATGGADLLKGAAGAHAAGRLPLALAFARH